MGNIISGDDDTSQQHHQQQQQQQQQHQQYSSEIENVRGKKEENVQGDDGRRMSEVDSAVTHDPNASMSMNVVGGDVRAESVSETFEEDEIARLFDTSLIPCTFRWEGGGREVFITGSFNNWAEKIQMTRTGNDFSHTIELPKGQYLYKFVVDDEWRFAPDQPTIADTNGHINNFLDISNFEATFGNMRPLDAKDHILSNDLYGTYIPEVDDYAKEPPPLPPHLRQIILNHRKSEDPPSILQTPLHVNLDHLYCTAVRDGLMVLGTSQRYRRKFVTTVFYSPVQGSTPPVSTASLSKGSLRSGSSGSKRISSNAGNTFPESSVPAPGSLSHHS